MGLWVYGSMGLWAYGSAATACFHHPQSIVLITYSMQPIPSVDASASDASATRRASTLCTAWVLSDQYYRLWMVKTSGHCRPVGPQTRRPVDP
eukprot:516823-Prorocentrum_minimum.AAC.1